jgi:hypothetical protein
MTKIENNVAGAIWPKLSVLKGDEQFYAVVAPHVPTAGSTLRLSALGTLQGDLRRT